MSRYLCHRVLLACAVVVLSLRDQAAGGATPCPSCLNDDIAVKGDDKLDVKTARVDDNKDDSGNVVGGVEPEDHAILQANYYKRLHKSNWSLADWQKHGFALEHKRAKDFEALRLDEIPCEHTIPRLDVRKLSTESFRALYEENHQPVIVKGIPAVMEWLAWTVWTLDVLEKDFSGVKVKVASDDDKNDLTMYLDDFIRYLRVQKDDSPLYMFDDIRKNPDGRELSSHYTVPDLFPEDLFAVMGATRPPYRWMLIGPKRSGSTVHVDPLGTSAWNTLLVGRKLWVLSPPGTLNELRGIGEDQQSYGKRDAIKYFVDTLPTLREKLKNDVNITVLVQHPGETIFVPAGWAHGVLNLDDTIAVTQNFVSSNNFDEVWKATRLERPAFALRWLQRLLETHTHLVHRALRLDEEDNFNLMDLIKQEREALADRGNVDDDE